MATAGTIVYNKDQQQIYPISHAEVVISNASGSKSDVEDNLVKLWKKVSELSGDSEAASNIMVVVTYCKTNTKDESEVKKLSTWSDIFELPDSERPYVWKKTLYTYKGDTAKLNEIYEIVATDIAEKIQNIYIARSTGVAPVITYPILKDGYGDPILDSEGNTQEDLTAFDNKLPEGWSETPVSIGPATPYVFISTRKRVEGLWKRYSEPAQYGRWAFDSQLELRYTITSGDKPAVNTTSDDPGSQWSSDTPDNFTGKMWMITATLVNGVLNSDENNVRWHGPHLMSIIQ